MQTSILIPTYNRPTQLAEAIASVAIQDLALIEEVLVGDNSNAAMRDANAAVIAASPIAGLIRHLPNDPPTDNFQNQYGLAKLARCEHVLILHDDDHLSPGGLAHLVNACVNETDERVKVWFGRNYTMDEDGRIDMERTAADTRAYGKAGPADARPLWLWCVTQSLPPNSALMERKAYLQHMEGPRDGNVGDWGLWVRLSNSGAWGRFVAEFVWAYRVQAASQTSSGRGMDAHRFYELGLQLKVEPGAQPQLTEILSGMAPVATLRYLRDGERLLAFKCLSSPHWTWRQRLSMRGVSTFLMILTPRPLWLWALHHRNSMPLRAKAAIAPPQKNEAHSVGGAATTW